MSLLHTPISVGTLELANRLVMPPMATSKATAEGTATQALYDYYAEKAAGGHLGLIITEHCYVNPVGRARTGQLSLARDADIDGLARLTYIIHQAGPKVMAQISHAGGAAKPEVEGQVIMGPSAVPTPKTGVVPQEMSINDIHAVVDDFAAAARRAQAAGYDGVEIHAAHGYLLNQFYSPLTNKRSDAYGAATIENRVRLHREVIAAVRDAVGPDFPVAIRLGACDYQAGGSTLQDAVAAAPLLEQAGADLLDISGGLNGYLRPGVRSQGYFSDVSEAIKRVVSIPVLLTGGITEPRAAEALLQAQKADLIGVGRAILKDSNWPARALQEVNGLGR